MRLNIAWPTRIAEVSIRPEGCIGPADPHDRIRVVGVVPLAPSCVLSGVVVVVDPGIVPINSRGEKQRMHLRDGFLADQLDPIYVAYNM